MIEAQEVYSLAYAIIICLRLVHKREVMSFVRKSCADSFKTTTKHQCCTIQSHGRA